MKKTKTGEPTKSKLVPGVVQPTHHPSPAAGPGPTGALMDGRGISVRYFDGLKLKLPGDVYVRSMSTIVFRSAP